MIQTTWNPAIYLKFAAYRARPVEDLLPRLELRVPGAIYDLGCGPGNVTLKLKDRWPDRAVTGLDSSPHMLAEAEKKFGAQAISWHQGDIATWSCETPAALVFANAALHWVPDHAGLFPRLLRNVAPGGLFAAQMPVTSQAPYHACMQRIVAAPKWRNRLSGVRTHAHPHAADYYYDLLSPLAADVDTWETHYHHVMEDHDAVTAWAMGTALVPFLTALNDSEKQEFLADYTATAAAAYPRQADGKVLFTMRRLFIVAVRA